MYTPYPAAAATRYHDTHNATLLHLRKGHCAGASGAPLRCAALLHLRRV